MKKNTDYKSIRHSIFNLKYHLIVVTKYRNKCINKELMEEIKIIATNTFNKWGCEILEIEWEPDHVHILFSATPNLELSQLVWNFKTVSSRLIRKKYWDYLSQYFWKPVFWSHSYCIISCWWAPLEKIKEYILNQESPTT